MTRPGWENTCEHGLDLASCSKCQVAAAIAAAEERGRRRGVEERDELRALLGKLVAWADLPATKAVTMSAWVHGVKYRAEDVAVWDEARAALAPRDSGKEPE